MTAWSFDVARHPEQAGPALWQDALARLCLPGSRITAPRDQFFGRVSCLVTPGGIGIARIDAAAQDIAGRYVRQPDGIWLALLLEGEAQLSTRAGGSEPDEVMTLRAGDIAYGPVATYSALHLPDRFSLLYIRLPRLALNPRLLGPSEVRVGMLARDSGLRRVFAGMLSGLAASLDELRVVDLRPLELSISEFLIASVLGDAASSPSSCGPTGARLALLHRICQMIEAELGDPELSLTKVARQQGTSPRNLQKLFELCEQTFGGYVRRRRLERCRSDLASPLQAHLSISEICFRWGFNDAAHFSRTFREQFSTTPRAWRQSQLASSGREDAAVDPDMHPLAPVDHLGDAKIRGNTH